MISWMSKLPRAGGCLRFCMALKTMKQRNALFPKHIPLSLCIYIYIYIYVYRCTRSGNPFEMSLKSAENVRGARRRDVVNNR